VPGLRRERKRHKHHVAGGEQPAERKPGDSRITRLSWRRLRIVAHHARPEWLDAGSDRPSYLAHSEDAHSGLLK